MTGPADVAAGASFWVGATFGTGEVGVSGSSCRKIVPAFGACCATAGPATQTTDAVNAASWANLFGIVIRLADRMIVPSLRLPLPIASYPKGGPHERIQGKLFLWCRDVHLEW